MSNPYLEKIAETLTAQEQAALANGRDRYTSQAVLGGVGGNIAGHGIANAALYGASHAIESPIAKGLVAVAKHAVPVTTLAGIAAGGVKAFRHNSVISEAGKKDPRAYDTALINGNSKGYVGSTLGTVVGAATAGVNAPVAAIGNIGETIYHNRLVEAAKKRQIAGYDN